MELYNTLTRKKEFFAPQKSNQVSFYTCGPTVYDYAHIGNLRTYVFGDVLKRTLLFAQYSVKQVMNITDIDDKTLEKSKGNKEDLKKITRKYEEAFISDIKELNILLPDKFTRATEYIDKMVELINILLQKGYAYKANDGSVYFSIAKFKDYGKLSKLDKEGIKSGARVNQDEYEKENPADFVLWKAWDEADGDVYWATDLGKGRPGWHIECSAMSRSELGETIDIHAGAVDLVFPHHENEIAQSEGASGKEFVRFWIHGEHLLVDGKKMSKSANNFYLLADIVKKGFDPLDFRYLCLGAHYRSKLNFTWEGLEGAKNSRQRLLRLIQETRDKKQGTNKSQISNSKYLDDFKQRVFDDLDVPGGLAVMWEMMRDGKISNQEKILNITEFDKVLGLDLLVQKEAIIPSEITELAKKRDQARAKKDYSESDKLRAEIESKGYIVDDTDSGSKVYPK